MRGGQRVRRLALASAVSVAVGLVAGCGPEDGPKAQGRPSAAPSTVSYDDWQPVYDDVRAATAADLQTLQDRVHELNDSLYTVRLDDYGAEVASTADHVRVRFFGGSSDSIDLHLDQDPAAAKKRTYVVCFAAEESCVEVGPKTSTGGSPHVFNNGIDSFLYILMDIVASQQSLVDRLSTRDSLSATIESPTGTLDCLVSGGTAEDRADLEGQPVELSPDPVVREGEPFPVFPVCVDQHGLVILAPSFLSPVVPYSSFETGVPDGMDEHPVPVPYGETPSPTPSPAPSSTETQSLEGPLPVLVATATIEAGESLLSAQQTGKLSLEVVSADAVVPGAVDSTDGLRGVALAEVPAGSQITADTFGPPN